MLTACKGPCHDSREKGLLMHSATAYINAGGRGTRLSSLFQPDPTIGVTKALLTLGRPPMTLVEHHIHELITVNPFTIVVGAGDHHHIVEHVEQIDSKGRNVETLTTYTQLGNGGDLVYSIRRKPKLFSKYVVVVNVDTLLTINLQDMVNHHRECGGELTIALTAKTGVPNERAFSVGPESLVLHSAELRKNPITLEEAENLRKYCGSSTGALVANTEFLEGVEWDESCEPLSLYRDIVRISVHARKAYAYNNGFNAFIDVGTVPTWQAAMRDPLLVKRCLNYS